MKRAYVIIVMLLLSLLGCSRTWKYPDIKALSTDVPSLDVETCQACHETEYLSWKNTKHSGTKMTERVEFTNLRECGACHSVQSIHVEDPQKLTASNPVNFNKTGQNEECGKCHFNQELFGRRAINPHDRHGILTSAGFEGHHKQLSCLDCHSGHKGKRAMLSHAKVHVCYDCHKEAIVTMGIFQPLNYVSGGLMCRACHTVHGGSIAGKVTLMGTGVCVICHFVGVAIVN